ncbi:MAG TPA: hypothetical protein VKT70_15605, partial [Stellaceae bacterium]|nr:hypothetical protein [Stellaceae bacterium]
MTIDFAKALRRIRPDHWRTSLRPNDREAVVAAADLLDRPPAALVLDTNVYIRGAAGTLPAAAA